MDKGPDIERYLGKPLTDAEKRSFSEMAELEFEDPVAVELGKLHGSRNAVREQLRAIMTGRGGATRAEAKGHLFEKVGELNEQLRMASDAVVENVKPKEQAISTLAAIYGNHDHQLLQNIVDAAKFANITYWPKETIEMFARSYADPDGIAATTIEEMSQTIFSRDDVLHEHDDKLRTTLAGVLKRAPTNKKEWLRNAIVASTIGGLALGLSSLFGGRGKRR